MKRSRNLITTTMVTSTRRSSQSEYRDILDNLKGLWKTEAAPISCRGINLCGHLIITSFTTVKIKFGVGK